MSNARTVSAVAVFVALAWAIVPVAEAQPPIRIGAALSLTGTGAALGKNRTAATRCASSMRTACVRGVEVRPTFDMGN